MSKLAITKPEKLKKVKRPPVAKTQRPSTRNIGKDPITGKTIPHEYDARIAQTVGFYTATGLSDNEIAVLLNMRPGKLKQLYGHELETGLNKANVEVAQSMHRAAKEGDVVAGKFWLKARAGWKDGENVAPPASPLQIHIHDD